MSRQIVVLGAGPPHRGSTPAALRRVDAVTPVLEWVLDALGAQLSDVTFVAGYQAAAIRRRYPGLPVVESPDWETTGSAASLLATPLDPDRDLVVCYSDVLFRAPLVDALLAADAPVTAAWDSRWRDRYAGRSTADIVASEKVMVSGSRLVRLGPGVDPEVADGEFVGLVRVAAAALGALDDLRAHRPESLARAHLAGLLDHLRGLGVEVAGVDAAGDWAEVNEARDVAHFVLGTKAETLERLRGPISTAHIQDQVAFDARAWRRDPDAVVARVRARLGTVPLVVRSSASSEDSFTTSNAGGHASVLDVTSDEDLAHAITTVLASYGDAADTEQVLVQPMVADVALAGVAFTRTLDHGAPWTVVNFAHGADTASITGGTSREHHTLVVRRAVLDADPAPAALASSPVAPVVRTLTEIESLLGLDALDVEFALDTAGVVHVLQVRPLVLGSGGRVIEDAACDAALADAHATWRALASAPPAIPGDPPPVYGVMPDWNPAEIIGTRPGALAVTLYRDLIMDEVWAEQRAGYGYRDVRGVPLLVTFAGRPYVDVRASFTSFQPAALDDGLAARLVAFELDWLRAHPDLHDKVEFDVVPTCVAPDFGRWEERLTTAGGFGEDEVAALRRGLIAITAAGVARTGTDLATVEALAARLSASGATGPTAAGGVRALLDDVRDHGTLPFAHLARGAFVAVSLLRGAVAAGAIGQDAADSFLAGVRTVSHELTVDARAVAEGRADWGGFVARYGHLRPGTYDITSPRYDADPDRFLRPLVEHAAGDAPAAHDPGPWLRDRPALLAVLADLGLPSDADTVERFLREAIEGRESAKFVFTRGLSDALELLARAGERHGLDRDVLAELPLDELVALADDATPSRSTHERLLALAAEGAARRAVTSVLELPALIRSEDDLDAFVLGAGTPNFVGTRAVTGECVELGGEDEHAPEVVGRIALVPQADPGYDWLFGQGIVGLVTLYGGANSHMAIRAAEFGLPAAIGVGEQHYRRLAAATVIEIDPVDRRLRVVR